MHRGGMMHGYVNMVRHWCFMVIAGVMLLNMVNIWMMYGDLCMVNRNWMVHWNVDMMECWLFVVVVRVMLFHTMHFWVMWSNWVAMCSSMHWKVLSRMMHISVDVSVMLRRNWVPMNSGMNWSRWHMHIVVMFWDVGVVSLFRNHL